MLSYSLRRLLLAVPTFLGITFVTFGMIHLAPGDPVTLQMEGPGAHRIPKEVIEAFRREYNLDKPIPVQYFLWVKKIAMLDFGRSSLDHRPVVERILERLPATVILNAASVFLMFAIGIPLGLVQAVRHKTWFDRISGVLLYVGWSLPSFWLGILLIIFFAAKLQWLPMGGSEALMLQDTGKWTAFLDRLSHLILPTLTLTAGSLAFMARFSRAALLEVVRQDYIRTAMAKGLSNRVVFYKHALRNAMIPILTLFGNIFPFLVSGSIIIEIVFSWPGVGMLVYKSLLARDYPTIMGMTFLTSALVLLSMLMTDLLYAVADPRVKYS
jgi:peptide/nickel transport system permease protein